MIGRPSYFCPKKPVKPTGINRADLFGAVTGGIFMDPGMKKLLLVALLSPLIGFALTHILGDEKSFVSVMRYAVGLTLVYTMFKNPPSLTEKYFIPFLIIMLALWIAANKWLK